MPLGSSDITIFSRDRKYETSIGSTLKPEAPHNSSATPASGAIHESVPGGHPPAVTPDRFTAHTVFESNPRNIQKFSGQKHIGFVQYLVVLQAMKQCVRRHIRR